MTLNEAAKWQIGKKGPPVGYLQFYFFDINGATIDFSFFFFLSLKPPRF